MSTGYTGRILRVDLSNKKTWVEEHDDAFYRTYLGGRALTAYYLLRETSPGLDPLGPENLLVMAPGPLTGAPFSGQGRNGFGAKSPLTGGFGNAEAGGYWGAELKRAGFDAVVVAGRAEKPVYLWIKDQQVEIRDASGFWGLEVLEAQEALRKEVGEPLARTCLIGPAGENLVRYACLVNDVTHFGGRTGLGAVMGSKNLKGVVTRASKTLPLADPGGVKALAKWMSENLELVANLYDVGTAGGLRGLSVSGGLPAFNFQEGSFAGDEKITGATMRDTILKKRDTCYACAVRCKRVVEVTEGPIKVRAGYGGPEYESLAALGSDCGVDDLIALSLANERCAALGLDTISTGAAIAFAMECYQNGLIGDADDEGRPIEFGDTDTMLRLVDDIGHRRGIGDLLAEGVKRAAEKIGPASEKYALHVKGQEVPMHEPRIKHGLGLGYIVSPTGADHQHNMHDPIYATESHAMMRMRQYYPFETLQAHGFDDNKLKLLLTHTNFRHAVDSSGMCHFLPYSPEQLSGVMNAATGWDTDKWELLRIGERASTLARLYNIREGLDHATDELPKRFFGGFRNNNSATGKPLDREELLRWRSKYYEAMGWDARTGVPGAERLAELGVGWASEAAV